MDHVKGPQSGKLIQLPASLAKIERSLPRAIDFSFFKAVIGQSHGRTDFHALYGHTGRIIRKYSGYECVKSKCTLTCFLDSKNFGSKLKLHGE